MTVPNILTIARIVLTVALYIPAFQRWRTVLIAGFVVAFVTDLLDGYLARKLGQTSYLGMRLDSFADYLLIASAIVWSMLLEPTLFRDHTALWMAIAVAAAIPQGICFWRHGRNAGFHLYSTKAAGWAAAILFLHAIGSGKHSVVLLHCFAFLAIVKSLEETLICLLVPNPYADLRPSALSYL
jgi:phosphatidylglycerophosphate synthase